MSDNKRTKATDVGILLLGAVVRSQARTGRRNKRDPDISLHDILFDLMGPTFKRDGSKFRKSETLACMSLS